MATQPKKPAKAHVKVKDLKARKNPKGGLNPQPEPPMIFNKSKTNLLIEL